MSSTVICHNFASETSSLKLKVAAEPAPAVGFGNWSFLQSAVYSVDAEEGCYSHPAGTKPSPFTALSDKSLELCTENLGSETGTDTVTVTDCSSTFSCFTRATPTASFWTESRTLTRNPCREVPPPLTTMCGSNSLQVSRRTEPGGRLIIEAVETPFRYSYLQVERSDGRLRLSFCSTADAEEEDDENEEYERGGETAEERIDGGCEFECSEDDEGIEFDGEINLKMEMEKFRRLSGCKRGSHGNDDLSCNWKPMWVATS